MEFNFNDGGRADAGYKGRTGDCVTRAVAIAAELLKGLLSVLKNLEQELEQPAKVLTLLGNGLKTT